MPSSGMLRRVALVRSKVSEKHISSIIRVKKIGELGTTHCEELSCKNRRLGGTDNLHYHGDKFRRASADSCYPDDEGNTYLQYIGPYKSHTV
jgi:hypothetical protein